MNDHVLERTVQTEYDLSERPMEVQIRNTSDSSLVYRTELSYDGQNRLTGFGEETPGKAHKTEYTYDNDNRVTGTDYTETGISGTYGTTVTYDTLGRQSTCVVNNGSSAGRITSNYSYLRGSDTDSLKTTPLVSRIDQKGISYEYTYDVRGNIVSEKSWHTADGESTAQTVTYAYDAIGQLVRVNDPYEANGNNGTGVTWVYTYDMGGNILSKHKYAYTTGSLDGATPLEVIPYAYADTNWRDKLTSYYGNAVQYDAIGNPTRDFVWNYEWAAGRQLRRMYCLDTDVSFTYDHNGLRVGKHVVHSVSGDNGNAVDYTENTEYTLHGKLVTHMKLTHTDSDNTVTAHEMHFYYDARCRPVMVSYAGAMYSYLHNLQGDIVGMLDGSGNLVVEYRYDAWGRQTAVTGDMANTLRLY